MLDHHIQRSIVYRLALLESARFSDLKPDDLDNKLFTYHLKKVMAASLVTKNDDGQYQLTPEGRRLGIHVFDKQLDRLDQATSVLFLVVRRKTDGAWLLYRRKTHPLIDRAGFMHTRPVASEDVTVTAQTALRDKTSLEGQFKLLGSGYFRVYAGDNLESFTHFTLLSCEDAGGDLQQLDDHAEYWWETQPDFTAQDMLPNMALLAEAYQRGELFFIDETLHL